MNKARKDILKELEEKIQMLEPGFCYAFDARDKASGQLALSGAFEVYEQEPVHIARQRVFESIFDKKDILDNIKDKDLREFYIYQNFEIQLIKMDDAFIKNISKINDRLQRNKTKEKSWN